MSTDAFDFQYTTQLSKVRAISERWFRAMIEKSTDLIVLVDHQRTLLYVSPSVEALLGYNQDILYGQKASDFIHPDDREEGLKAFTKLLEEPGKSIRLALRVRHNDNTWRWLEGTVTNYLDDPDLRAVVGNYRDITDRKHVEEELQTSEQRYRLIVEHSTDIIALSDPSGIFSYVSPAVEETLGYRPEELIGTNIRSLIHPDDQPALYNKLQKAIQGELITLIYRCRNTNGKWIVLETKGTAILHSDKQPLMLAFTSHDITTRMEIEKRKDEFLSTTSHELRGPLTTIKASIQLAQRQLQRIEQETVEEIIQRVKKMLTLAERQIAVENRLIGDLLDVSRIQQNKLELHLKNWNLVEIVQDVVDDIQAVEQLRAIHLNRPPASTIIVYSDKDRISQVITNYLTNALKYSPADQPIEVTISEEETRARVDIKDKGAGLTRNEQESVWDRFYQSPNRDKSGGSSGLGLGLYICRSIIEQHQGQVGVESLPGQGSTFWFILPRHRGLREIETENDLDL